MNTIQDRIRMIIKMHNLNSSGFADKIGVQRSSLSHILSGRNNPSLDFLEKTLAAFPRVNGDWLITGQVKKDENNEAKPPQNQPTSTTVRDQTTKENRKPYLRTITRITVFYSDGTFEDTYPSSKPAKTNAE